MSNTKGSNTRVNSGPVKSVSKAENTRGFGMEASVPVKGGDRTAPKSSSGGKFPPGK